MKEFLSELRQSDISVRLVDGNLSIKYPKGKSIAPEVLEGIRVMKHELLEYLAALEGTGYADIPTAPVQESYPLSSSQRRLWVLSQLEEGSQAYHIGGAYEFNGDLDIALLGECLQVLIKRHEVLRTVFRQNDAGEISQYILSSEELAFALLWDDLRNETEVQEKVAATLKADVQQSFDLSAGPLLRARLIQVDDTAFVFSFVMHHIITDAWSMELLIREMLTLYNAFSEGRESPLPPLRIQYKDYAVWQQQQLSSSLGRHKAHWINSFQGELPLLDIAAGKLRPALKTYNGATVSKEINVEIVDRIKVLCRKQGSTMFMSLLAGVNALLHFYSGQEDIILGSPIAGREHADLENQVGFYLNTLALRMQFRNSDNFIDLLVATKKVLLSAYEHQSYPFDQLVEDLSLKRDTSRNALFDVMVVYLNEEVSGMQVTRQNLGDLSVRPFAGGDGRVSKFDLTFSFTEGSGSLKAHVEYNTDIYNENTASGLLHHLEQVLSAVTASPLAPLNELEWIDNVEREKIISSFNHTTASYPDRSIISLFEERVERVPDNVALVFGNVSLSYKELNEVSNQLADYLRKQYDCKNDELVGLVLQRSPWMVISILAVLKASAAYVPIDPNYPQERIGYIVSDSGCKVLLNEEELDKFRSEQERYSKANVPVTGSLNDLAYVIYTSGTTGQPKGVMIEHGSVANVVHAQTKAFGIDETENILQFSNYAFDASVEQIWLALCNGAKLVLLPQSALLDQEEFYSILNKEKITHLHATPGFLQILQPGLYGGLKRVIAGGEACSHALAASWSPLVSFYNEYGPTETTITATEYLVTSQDDASRSETVSIGKPLSNVKAYILDDAGRPVAIGLVGELHLGGVQLARGYLNQPELTAEKFIDSPFCAGERLYKTGDLARWLPDGNIVYMGRKDDQLKIRGYRIEPAEIEKALLSHENIDAAVVVAKENKDAQKELVAYIVSRESLSAEDIATYLRSKLPDYMIPARYAQLAEMPLTSNGKINKKTLPDPEGVEISAGKEYVAPRNDVEFQILAVWQEILGRKNISVKEHFFAAGGDSIKSIQVVSRLKQRGYSITIRDIMLHPVAEDLALYAKPVTRVADQELVRGFVPLSPIQRIFFNNHPAGNHHYNQSVLLSAKEPVSAEALAKALQALVMHHDALRMVYHHTPAGWVQENKGADFPSCFEILTVANEDEFTTACTKIQASLDLSEGPLFKATLIRGLEQDQLLLVAHHLVIDGVSWRIVLEGLELLYQQAISAKELLLPVKTDSFKYWQEQQMAYANSDVLRKEISWWSETDAVSASTLPIDHTEGSNLVQDITGASFELNEVITDKLVNRCYKAYRTDINDILLTGLAIAFREVFGMEKLLINLEGHGREPIGMDADVNRTVGWFTSLYPVLLDAQYSHDPIQQLIHTKEYLHRIPNKGIGYGILESFAGMQFTNKPQITFNYLGEFGNGVKDENAQQVFSFSGRNAGPAIAGTMQRDNVLDISGMMAAGKLNLAILYSDKQFRAETIQQLADAYRKHLEILVESLSAEETPRLTPVDLTYKGLTIEQLQELNADNNIEDVYPLSPLQEGLFYHWSVARDTFYFDQVHYRLKGKIDIDAVGRSYALLVDRHAVLRTHFTRTYGDRVLQVVKKKVDSEFIYREVDSASPGWLEQYKQEDIDRGFDLYSGSQMRLSVLDCGDDTYEFVWSHHHVLMDGWCTGILISEFFHIYNGLVEDKDPALGKAPLYSTYIDWLEQQDQHQSLHYWKNYLAGYDAVASVPKKDIKEAGVYKSAERTFRLSEEITRSIRQVCAQQGITENTFIQTLWGMLLARYNNANDVVFGIVVSGRPGEVPGVEKMVGLFINSIPLRIRITEKQSVAALLKQVHMASAEAAPYHYTQLADIQSETALGKDLFNHLVQFQNFPVEEMVQQSVQHSQQNTIEFDSFFAENDFEFTVIVSPGNELDFRLMYNGNLYEEAQVMRVQDHLVEMIRQVVANPEISVNDINCIDAAEQQELLSTFNSTAFDFPKEKTIINLFEEQALIMPTSTALVAASKSFTYQSLNEQSNQLAHYLRKEHEVHPNDIIGIKLEKREQMVLAILAVLKAGGAYLPIDPEYPDNRIAYMLEDSKCKLLIDEEEWSAFNAQRSRYSKENPVPVNNSHDLAYVIYTSGSTGKPKGVMVEHKSLVNLSLWQKNALNITPADRTSLYMGVAFDAAVMEFFPSVVSGACLYIIPKEIRLDAHRLAKYLDEHQVTISTLSAQMAEQFMEEENNSLRYLITGGDKLTACKGKNYAIVNQYGPTENTVVTTCYIVNKGVYCKRPPIGKPVNNVQVYILDEQRRLTPVGVPGELFAGGDSLSRGYINNAALTEEKFVKNPFNPNEKLYRTGDVCRWLPDGNIEFIGRRDEQIKIRGFRIELGEIENALLGYEKVSSAVVVAKTDAQGDKALVAYVTGDEQLSAGDIRTYLKAMLPDYMLPAHYVKLDALPLNLNGKVDKEALPDPLGLETAGRKYIAPRTATERKLVEIWEEVLGRKGIGAGHDFFESGGHSLRATRLSSQVHKKLNAEIPLSEIFANPVLEDQAALIEKIHTSTYTSISRVPEQDGYDLSASQRRLWILTQFDKANVAYNIPGVYEFRGKLDKDALQRSFKTLIDRHEILRTIFKENERGEAKQYVLAAEAINFEIVFEESDIDALPAILHREAATPFDLATGPLLRVKLIRTGEATHVFSYVMHHIISDGWSMQVIIRELLALYNAYSHDRAIELTPLRIQYKDFSAWQLEQLKGDSLTAHKQFWLEQMSGEIPVLALPTDRARPAVKTFNGATVEKTFNKDISNGLRRICQLQGGTLFMGLLAGVNALLYKYTGQEDIVIGTPVAGREHADLEDQVGFYINTLALRTKFKAEDNFLLLLNGIKADTLAAFDHQVYPFDDLVDHLSLPRDMSRNPVFDVFIILQNTSLGSGNAEGLEPVAIDPDKAISISRYAGKEDRISKFDLAFDFAEAGEEIVLNLQYNTDLFNRDSVNRLAGHLEQLFNTVITAPQTPVAAIDCLYEEERDLLVNGFNHRNAAYPTDKTLVDLFEEQVDRTPRRMAVCFENVALSYEALNVKANRLGAYLRTHYNIGPNDLVAIQLERSEWMIIALLGVLKAGGAYVPVDPAYPQDRINYMLQDSNCKVVINENELAKFKSEEHQFDPGSLPRTTTVNDLVYVIYTSGSTGRPKGVMVEHKGLVNTVLAQIDAFGITGDDRGLQFASFSFDAFASEVFIILLTGASLTIAGTEERRSPELFTQLMIDNAINVVTLSPAFLRQLDLGRLQDLKVLITAGEAAQYDLFTALQNKSVVYNAYGPTEASICGTVFNLASDAAVSSQNIPIGSAIANARIYVLDDHSQLLPVNVPGEICIAGPGVARGYLNQAALTEEKFVADPFVKGERMYRTGDLGRWLPDGNLEYIGRKDTQVKVRGYRIEPGEIENALRQHDNISEAAVIVKVSGREKELAAYVVSEKDLIIADVRAWLKDILPSYMVPAYIVQLAELPMNANGKLDKKSLPDPSEIIPAGEYVAPHNQLEEKLAAIWEQVLNRKNISVTENFFDAGGNSIKIVQLAKLIGQELNITVSVGALFQHASIRELVQYINQDAVKEDQSIDHNELISELDKFNLDDNE